MKASAQIIGAAVVAEKSWATVYSDLFKARLTLLVLLTTLVGFFIGNREGVNYLLMANTIFGMTLIASGGAALNQLFERNFDARMRRTRDRPLPSGRLTPQTVLVIGTTLSVLGVLWLGIAVNLLSSAAAAFTLLVYVFLYTPLKRITWLNTLVGAVPGAMPPLIGWVAARDGLGIEGLTLFAIQAFWQVPHFYAIAWLYRDDYADAGFKMLPVLDPEGVRTGRQSVVLTGALWIASLCPYLLNIAGPVYLVTALALGSAFLFLAIQFARQLTTSKARQLFYWSILYLPVLLSAMVIDKVR